MNELKDIQPVCDCLGTWLGQIRSHNAVDFFDINRVAENVAATLLNLIYNLELENLNLEKKNFPGIDLGDKKNKIAFQVTSRKDPKKIEEDLKTFAQNYKNIFYNEIRFLILNNEKPHLSKKKYAGIFNEFVPDRDILNDKDLIREIKKIYRQDSPRFERIREFLEKEFGRERVTHVDALKILREGSKKYYKALRGPNGRFRYLNISEILLPGTVNRPIDTMVSINTPTEEEKNLTVLEVLPVLWAMETKHAVIVGDGGMGKTVSLLQWWEQLLGPGKLPEPVPVFIALNEFNQVLEGKREDFIISSVLNNYGGENGEQLTVAQVKKTMKTPLRAGSDFIPSIVLLLDGFNEITVERRELLLELNHLAEQCPGIQIVITSRYDMRGNFNWGHWNLVRLKELEEEKIEAYLQGKGMAVPGQERLRVLLRNPMMLTLYAASCDVQENQQDSRYCCFKDTVETPGELLWNFIEAQVAKLPERVGLDESQTVYYWFLLKFLLPGLGYEMEKAGLFAFTYAQFQEHLDHLCQRFSQDDFLTAFPKIGKNVTKLPLGGCSNVLARHERAGLLNDIFCNELCMLVEEVQTLRFLHQNFRDFFAAVHILNEAEISISKDEIPGIFKERILDYFIHRLLGEIEEEHRSKPYLVKDKGWKININKENRLYKVLDICRGKFRKEVGFSVWNIVTIWKEVRGELSGADLSNLDLSGVLFNGVLCSRFYEGQYLAAVFDCSRIHEKNLFPQGHSGGVRSAVYSPDGKKILSASGDKTIKEWEVGTYKCVKTLVGHSTWVNSAVYSLDGENIISSSGDKTIKKWNAGTGKCVKTFAGHKSDVKIAVYSPNGKKILSASWDKTIKEWDAETGECVKSLAGHSGRVNSVVYSPDGEKIISASDDHTIKEWDVGTGKCMKTLTGHTKEVISAVYNPDGKKILSASFDNTIKEWNAGTGKCVRTLAGHSTWVRSVMYSPDGKNIISASDDKTIKKWDSGTGECVKTLTGHTFCINIAVYSPDGKKILSASEDSTIKEWDVDTGECVKTLNRYYDTVTSAVYRQDGKRILSASSDKIIIEWDVSRRKCLRILTGHSDWVSNAAYSPDGEKILSSSYDHTIKEWDERSGQCVKTLTGHTREVISAVYNPDGNKILSYSFDETIKVWDVRTGECVKTLVGHTSLVENPVYSPDGKKILLVDHKAIKELDAATYKCLKIHKKEDNSIMPGFPPTYNNIKLKTKGNKIFVPGISGKGEWEILNVPGFYVQGCSFQNLEKGSEWSEKGLEILRQYNARL